MTDASAWMDTPLVSDAVLEALTPVERLRIAREILANAIEQYETVAREVYSELNGGQGGKDGTQG